MAFQVNALVGGTPAYLEMCAGAGPASVDDLPTWVARRLLNPASAMLREGSLLLREEPSISDPTSYAATLAAGHHRRSEIAAALGRQTGALAHLLSGLQDIGLVAQIDDALREKRSVFQITEPIVRLYQLLIARHEPELVAGRAERVWAANTDTVDSRILGSHFEGLARTWCFEHASEDTLGGYATHVRPTEIACREHRQGHEIDVVVTESSSYATDKITAIGEAKATSSPMDLPHLERLEHLRGLLPSTKIKGLPKLLLFARSGFTPPLAELSARHADIELIDLHRLYHGE